jgi:hypothetical protein
MITRLLCCFGSRGSPVQIRPPRPNNSKHLAHFLLAGTISVKPEDPLLFTHSRFKRLGIIGDVLNSASGLHIFPWRQQ